MKKFAFISTNSIKKYYDYILTKQKTHKFFVDSIKIVFLVVFIIACLFVYLLYISLASTQWYRYRQATNDLANVQFRYEIEKTEILEKTKNCL